ncbi:MAG TPA: hypothetical protein VIS78_00800 [Blastocatellia bacterium]
MRVKKHTMTRAGGGNGSSGEFDDQFAALAETALTPTIQNAFNQMISNRLALGNQLVTLLAFPLAARAAFCFFEYHCH